MTIFTKGKNILLIYKKRGKKAPFKNYFRNPNSLMMARYLRMSFFIK